MRSRRAYLDWNASAPLCDAARAAMLSAIEVTGNPSSVHADGRRARAIVERAREQVAALAGARPSEVVFTSGATEANDRVLAGPWRTILTSGIEHVSVLAPARARAAEGAKLDMMPVGADGVVRVQAAAEVIAALDRVAPALVSVQLANNETGIVQPVATVAAAAREAGARVHCDATQGAGRLPLDIRELGVDLMVLSAHKLGGPTGVGALIVRDGVEIAPLARGGGQELRRRAGTENVLGIAGFGAAAEAARRELAQAARVAELRDGLEAELKALTPQIEVVGEAVPRLANTSCVVVPGQLAETLVIRLDLAGVAVSAGSACSSGKVGRSHVLDAMGYDADKARSAVRISIGTTTSGADIEQFLAAWRDIVGTSRRDRAVA